MSNVKSFSESDRNGGGENRQQRGTDMQPQASEGIIAANQAPSWSHKEVKELVS